jgi:hypothetical protein
LLQRAIGDAHLAALLLVADRNIEARYVGKQFFERNRVGIFLRPRRTRLSGLIVHGLLRQGFRLPHRQAALCDPPRERSRIVRRDQRPRMTG